jgi:hypothetical protein
MGELEAFGRLERGPNTLYEASPEPVAVVCTHARTTL